MNNLYKLHYLAVVLTATMAMLATGCSAAVKVRPSVDDSYTREIQQWRTKRVDRLKGKLGWLKLAGLFWLKRGANTMGSDPSSDIILDPRAPSSLATITMKGQDVYLRITDGVHASFRGKAVSEMLLLSDEEGKREPDKITSGDFTFFIIDRGGRKALRLFDQQAQTYTSFKGLRYFPIDPRWRIEGKFVAFPQTRKVQISTAIGTTVEEQIRGEVRFSIGSETYSLQPVSEEGRSELSFVFGDKTNGNQTYGGGRFMDAKLEPDGKVILDFNKAYNPPCAFTAFATCPLPRTENRLPIEVTAGEMNYKEKSHENEMEHW